MTRTKSRGNGQGCAYRRGRTWEAQVVVGYRLPDDPSKQPIAIKRRKGGFPTKAAAIVACVELMRASDRPQRVTMDQLYSEWEKGYSGRVGVSTMKCYESAYKHFAPLHHTYIDLITARDLQDCMDACQLGKRTHQLMKVTARLLWAYALDADYIQRDITANLYTGGGESKQREPITEDELARIRDAIPSEPYAKYVVSMCFLGFRPGEFLRLKKTDLRQVDDIWILTGGSKTDAGRDRRVPVPAQILGIVLDQLQTPGEMLFPRLDGKLQGQEISDGYFNKHIFQPLMARLGITGKVPYSARHTYSDKLKAAAGDEKAKAAVMGHTDYAFTRAKYQSTTTSDLKAIADSLS